MNRYLKQLGRGISGTRIPVSSFPWGLEVENLVPAAFNTLAPSEPLPVPLGSTEQPILASPYYRAVEHLLQNINATTKVSSPRQFT
jgi:hypothetical protein